jgi:hypothetical protein
MKRLGLVCVLLLCATSMFAQNQRTWVSNAGVDTGTSCTLTAPCRTIAYAIAVTNAGGDVVILNSGGFGGGFLINKAVNIVAPDGVYGVLTSLVPGNDVVTIAAGLGDVIRIKGLNILSTDPTQGYGVNVQNVKRLELQDMTISNIGTGIKISQNVKVHINNVKITETGNYGIWSIGTNTPAGPGSASPVLRVVVENTKIIGTGIGVKLDSGSFFMGTNSEISWASVDVYQIKGTVPSCSSISLTNAYYNFFTGIPHINPIITQPVDDARDGMVNIGNCNF